MKNLFILCGALAGPLIGLAAVRGGLLIPVVITGVVLGPLGAIRVRDSLSRLSFGECLRWTFLIMLPAAVVGSVAAWPTLRTLSVFRLLYLGLCVGAPTWLLLKRRFSFGFEVGGFFVFLALWVVWALVSLAWAVDKAAGVKYVIFLVMMISLSVGTVLAVNTVRTVRILLLLLLLTFLMAIIIGLAEIVSDFRLPTSGLVGRPERFQWASTSFFHNQNDFASYITLWLPFLLSAAFFARRLSSVSAAALCGILSVVCLLHTGSRANLIGFALTLPSLLLVVAVRGGTTAKPGRLILGLIIMVAVALAAYLGTRGWLPVLSPPAIGQQHWRFGTLSSEIEAETGSGGNRIKLTMNGLQVLWNSHLLGVGPGNAEYHLQEMPGTELVYNLHNWWMEVLVNGGVLVFLGYLLFYAALVSKLFQVAVKAESDLLAYSATSLFAALIGYTFGGLAPSSAVHFTPMWIHFGLSLAVVNLHMSGKKIAQR